MPPVEGGDVEEVELSVVVVSIIVEVKRRDEQESVLCSLLMLIYCMLEVSRGRRSRGDDSGSRSRRVKGLEGDDARFMVSTPSRSQSRPLLCQKFVGLLAKILEDLSGGNDTN